ncbi:MAG: aminoacyl-histidine dipeptidase [bacterium]
MSSENTKTKEILKCFEELSAVPRGSKKEEKIRKWLQDWARKNNFESKADKAGNLIIKIPASKGYEKAPIVVFQGHLDMVCEKTSDSTHDFSRDPIKFVYDGEWLRADKTSLGADNGIAIAMVMVAATDKELSHPPLELLFTSDEETGLNGAKGLEPGFIEGKILLNLDSEDEGYLTVGCAGGVNTVSTFPVEFEIFPSGYESAKINVSGLMGGHSGVDIHRGRANAINLLCRTLSHLAGSTDLRIADIAGGSAHNAIPRDSTAVVAIKDYNTATRLVAEFEKTLKIEFKNPDPELKLSITKETNKPSKTLTSAATKKTLNLALAMPHGVTAMSTDVEKLVETSSNLANINIVNGNLRILTSQRSSLPSRLDFMTQRIAALTEVAGGKSVNEDAYPPWPAKMDSPLLKKCIQVFEKRFGKKPVIDIIHAGLECGIIGNMYPGMDMISFGPTLRNVHCPDERLLIPTIEKVWDFTVDLLASFKA